MTPTPEEPIDVQRVLMDRARHMAERDLVREKRPLLPRLVAFGLAVLVVGVVLFAFDRFLASMQRFLGLPVTDPEPSVTEPLPPMRCRGSASGRIGGRHPDAAPQPPVTPRD